MSEERLEEIKERLVLLNNAVDLDNETKDYIFNDLKIEWLVEQNKRYREAIERVKGSIPSEFNHDSEYEAKKNVIRLIDIQREVDEALEDEE